jgi:hypothetical protein
MNGYLRSKAFRLTRERLLFSTASSLFRVFCVFRGPTHSHESGSRPVRRDVLFNVLHHFADNSGAIVEEIPDLAV